MKTQCKGKSSLKCESQAALVGMLKCYSIKTPMLTVRHLISSCLGLQTCWHSCSYSEPLVCASPCTKKSAPSLLLHTKTYSPLDVLQRTVMMQRHCVLTPAIAAKREKKREAPQRNLKLRCQRWASWFAEHMKEATHNRNKDETVEERHKGNLVGFVKNKPWNIWQL